MEDYALDEIDRGILHSLQEEARHITTEDMGDIVGVSASTVRNRIAKMESAGIIRGYHPEIDYERAGYQLHVVFHCVASTNERSDATERALGIKGVIEVNELLGGEANVFIEAIAEDTDMLARITDEIAALPLDIRQSLIFRRSYVQPFNHFMGRASYE